MSQPTVGEQLRTLKFKKRHHFAPNAVCMDGSDLFDKQQYSESVKSVSAAEAAFAPRLTSVQSFDAPFLGENVL